MRYLICLICALFLSGCMMSVTTDTEGIKEYSMSLMQLQVEKGCISAGNQTMIGLSIETMAESGMPKVKLGYASNKATLVPTSDGELKTPAVAIKTDIKDQNISDSIVTGSAVEKQPDN